MTTADPTAWYDNHVHNVVAFFESYTFTDIHAWLEPLLPAPDGALVLDVGAAPAATPPGSPSRATRWCRQWNRATMNLRCVSAYPYDSQLEY